MYRSSRSEEELESLSESLVREAAPNALALAEHVYRRNRDSKFADPSTGKQRRMEQRMLGSLLSRIQDRSDESTEFCQLLATSEGFVSGVFCDMLKSWSPEYLGGNLSDLCSNLMFQLVTIMYNCLFKNDSFVNSNLAKFDLVGPVQPLLKSPEPARSLQALLLMAFALDESQADLFLGESDIIGHLVDGLRASLSCSERSFETGNMVYSLPELARCTQRLALNDVNKALLMKLGVLPAVKAMLEAAESQDVGAGLELAFTLSFEKDRQLKLAMGAEICDCLRRLATAKDWEMSQTLQGLLFNMGEKFTMKVLGPSSRAFAALDESADQKKKRPASQASAGAPSEPKPSQSSADVVLTYHTEQKDFVRKLREDLLQLGVSVWVDFKDAASLTDSLRATRDAVDSCRLVVVCLSRRFKETNSCRMHAERAADMMKLVVPVSAEDGYVPTGWLGQLCARFQPIPADAKPANEIRKRLANRTSGLLALRDDGSVWLT
ncbi:hypothetical protein BOX15_Mlig028223g1 [Macrostomum lignano]|uniref:TIR domain-containing protein n=1 Tax=Macrostomum lignano TaxID=282301 RepID=A0A267EJ87_9PLAT|nr:hypothetical protein BOX15_Mlig028223g1 [Macrostomum lignano]